MSRIEEKLRAIAERHGFAFEPEMTFATFLRLIEANAQTVRRIRIDTIPAAPPPPARPPALMLCADEFPWVSR